MLTRFGLSGFLRDQNNGGGEGGGAPETPSPTPDPTPAPAPTPDPTPAPAPTPTKFELPENWKDSLSEELKQEPSLGTIHSFEGLVKSFVHAQKNIGSLKVPIPKSDATDSEWGEVFTKLGRPESAEGYEVKPPEGFQVDDDFMKGFKQTAHEAGLLPRQVEKLFGWYADKQMSSAKAIMDQKQQQLEAATSALKKEWGEAFDQEMGRTVKFLNEHGGEEVFKSIEQAGLGSDPAFLKTMHKLAKEFGTEGTIINSRVGGASGILTPSEAQARINEIMGDGKSPYFDKSHPRHNDVVQEMAKLHKLAHAK